MNKLLRTEWKSVLKGAAIAGAGAALTFLSEYISGQDFGTWTPLLTAGLSVLVNAVRKIATAT